MQETKDPAIKLFGKTIPLPADGETPAVSGEDSPGASATTTAENSDHYLTSEEEKKQTGAGEELEEEKDLQAGETTEIEQENDAPTPISEESMDPETSLELNKNPKTHSIDEQNPALKPSKTEKEQSETTNSQEKTLKKPDKILPCPRCNSMETKFCYYNNYNINQPRHFCKSCQRYWTDGGTMRNVPVGAGRRKNKNSAQHYRHITISEALQTARIDAPNGLHHPTLKSNGTVLNFSSDASLSESMASVLNIAEKTMWNGMRNGFHKLEKPENQVLCGVGENGDDHSSCSSITNSNSMEEGGRNCNQEPLKPNFHGFPSQIPCLPGVPWPYPWNSAVPPPAFCHPAFPIFYPASYWNCALPGAWAIPWLSSPSSSPSQNAKRSGPNSTLGKHSRDDMVEQSNSEEEEPPKQKNSERNIWVPKTLRIDDPDEAAKSSIWTTLGIKHDSISKGGLFKAFQPKGDEKSHIAETSPVLRANPAALSRSLNFHESS